MPTGTGDIRLYGHNRGQLTLTPVAKCLALDLSLHILTTKVCPDRGSNPDLTHAANALPVRHRGGKVLQCIKIVTIVYYRVTELKWVVHFYSKRVSIFTDINSVIT